MPAYETLNQTQVPPHFQQSLLNTSRPPCVHWTEDSREEQEMLMRWLVGEHDLSSCVPEVMLRCIWRRLDHGGACSALPRGRGLGTPTAPSECLRSVQGICSMLVRKETSPEFVTLLLMELTWGIWSITTGIIVRCCTVHAGMLGLWDPPPLHSDCIYSICMPVYHKNSCLTYDPMSSILILYYDGAFMHTQIWKK